MTESQQLLAQYVESGSETAFRELVTRYVNLVYCAAVRLVNGDTHLAEDVTQMVFADLARLARTLPPKVMLGGWLHRHTCFVASKTLRGERRRQARERQAVEMNALEDHSAANLALVGPLLDDAINQLRTEDRTAILLRFFEQQDFRSVGEALETSEEAARKRVDRALAKLHGLLTRRGVALSGAALATALATQVVAAAPAGLAASISTAALGSVAAGSTTTFSILQIMSMTKLQISIVSVVVAAGLAIPWAVQQRTQTKLRETNESLRQQVERNSQLTAENERLSKLAARASTMPTVTTSPSLELLKLRGEVGRLRREIADTASSRTNAPSALSGLTSNPEMWKTLRDQQKLALAAIYKDFAKRVKLPKDQEDKLADVLADNVMDNIDQITAVLRAGMSPGQMQSVFAAQDAALAEKALALLGPESFSQYQDYTRNLASQLTADQFKAKLSGDKAAKEEKTKQLFQALQEETQRALASAGLSADFQTVPSLNFRNFASEAETEKSLKLLDDIYASVAARAGSFLSLEEIAKFNKFRTNAINQNRIALTMNRKLMAPGSN